MLLAATDTRAADPLSSEEHALEAVELGLTVSLIATRNPLTCEIGDHRSRTCTTDLSTFDYVPVTERDRTVGLLHRGLRQVLGLQ